MTQPLHVDRFYHVCDALVRFRPAALFDLGRSDWLRSFAPQHLARCRHYRLVFYDELFDVICEDVECRDGGYQPDEQTANGR